MNKYERHTMWLKVCNLVYEMLKEIDNAVLYATLKNFLGKHFVKDVSELNYDQLLDLYSFLIELRDKHG